MTIIGLFYKHCDRTSKAAEESMQPLMFRDGFQKAIAEYTKELKAKIIKNMDSSPSGNLIDIVNSTTIE